MSPCSRRSPGTRTAPRRSRSRRRTPRRAPPPAAAPRRSSVRAADERGARRRIAAAAPRPRRGYRGLDAGGGRSPSANHASPSAHARRPSHISQASAAVAQLPASTRARLLLERRQRVGRAVATTVQIGWPAEIRSPGCGTSRTPCPASARCRRSSRPRWRTGWLCPRCPTKPRRAAALRRSRAGARRRRPRRSKSSSEAVGRGLTSSVHARSAVPDEVDAEQAPQRERARHARADRARLTQQRALAAGSRGGVMFPHQR